MDPRIIVDPNIFALTIERLCHQLIENHGDFSHSCIVGVQPRGVFLSDRIYERLRMIQPGLNPHYGKLDITFYRDDFRRREIPLAPSDTDMEFSIEGKNVILVDDVLFTGRTIRAALDALLDFGRPANVELLVLVDRRFSRQFPISPDYVGLRFDAVASEKVKVEWKETEGADKIWIMKNR